MYTVVSSEMQYIFTTVTTHKITVHVWASPYRYGTPYWYGGGGNVRVYIRGGIDNISIVYSQNPTFTSTWQNKLKNLSQRKDEKIQNDDTHFPLKFDYHCQIANIILCYFCRCNAEILFY